MVLIVTLIQVFLGVITVILWFTYGLTATVFALIAFKPRRPWFRRLELIRAGRLFVVLLTTWGASWIASILGYTIVTAIYSPGQSAGYLFGVLGSAALGAAPFFLVYTLTSALQLQYLLRNRSERQTGAGSERTRRGDSRE